MNVEEELAELDRTDFAILDEFPVSQSYQESTCGGEEHGELLGGDQTEGQSESRGFRRPFQLKFTLSKSQIFVL